MDQLHQGTLSPNAGVPLDGPLSSIPNAHDHEVKAAFAELEGRLSPHTILKMTYPL